jgi:glycosyltransferase involved in cell wall biosynthesis
MRIVMDFRKYDGVVGGVERAVMEIAEHLALAGHGVIVLPKGSRLEEVRESFRGMRNIELVPLGVRSHAMSLRNLMLDSTTIQRIARECEADVVHFPYNWSFPVRKHIPSVLTIHDVIPLTFREAMGLLRNRLLYRPGIRLACRLNNVIVTVSEFSRHDIAAKLGIPQARIRVIPNGIRDPYPRSETLESRLAQRFELEEGFVLYVGGIHERKNVPRLIEAFAEVIGASGFAGRLLITGRIAGAPYQERMRRACEAVVQRLGLEKRVVFTDFVSDEELDALMRKAVMLVYPSLYEGFGIPVLEAMRAGLPVVTSSCTALPEVAGDAALLIDPRSVEEIAAAMARLLQDDALRDHLRQRGTKRAQGYTWERTAQAYLDLYEEVARARRGKPAGD